LSYYNVTLRLRSGCSILQPLAAFSGKIGMCGIIGYIGNNTDTTIGLEALKRLEYRGYDSAGMALLRPRLRKGKPVPGQYEVFSMKAVGRISKLEEKLGKNKPKGTPFIFHTRWATHGAPTLKNAHPHTDFKKEFYVVHNGIIENYQELRVFLETKGYKFTTDTDTEVLPNLISYFFKGSLLDATQKAVNKVRGTYGIAVISSRTPNELVAARFGSPLLIGVGDGEYFISSDPSGILDHTKRVVYLEEGETAQLTKDSMKIYTQDKMMRRANIEHIEWTLEEAQKGGYDHFMLKEIMEQPHSIIDSIRGRMIPSEGNVRLGGLEDKEIQNRLKDIENIHIIACGTAFYAGLVGKYMLEEYAGIPTEVTVGSEFRYKKPILNKKTTAVLAISQSGETADTIASLREAKQKGVLTLGIVNVIGSTIARETDAGVYNHAGPEIGVASTKAFTSQLAVLALLTVFLGRQREMSATMGRRIVEELERLPQLVERVLKNADNIKNLAKKYKDTANMSYLGRKYNYPIALEGALKLKEVSYINSQGYPGGEMKHGPIALVDKNFPILGIAPRDSVYEKMLSNLEEIKTRGGPIILLTTDGNKKVFSLTKDVMYIPKTLEMLTPILSIIPLQLFAYYMALLKGYDIDKPRNLAKSVTVE